MDDAPDACPLAGLEQGSAARDVHAGGRFRGRILEDAGAVHNRIDACEMRQPVLRPDRARHVDGDEPARGKAPGGGTHAAGHRHHLVALLHQPRQYGRADETGCTCKQNAHERTR